MSLTQNPFDKEENLTSWFSQDNLYQSAKKSTLTKLKTTTKFKQTSFMSIQESYLKIINSITKHAFLATIIMLIALGSVGASAAELLAPKDFKPSTLIQKTFNPKDFQNNQQQDKNPYTALKSDDKNDVVLLEKCNLAIKYPKRYDNKFNTVVYRGDTTESQLDYAYIFPKAGELKSGEEYFGPSVSCSKNKPDSLELIDPMYVQVYPEFKDTAVIGKEVLNINIDYIKKNMGWFITEAELSSIRLFDNPNIPGDYTLYFVHDKIHYLVDFQLNDLKTKEGDSDGIIPVIKANQIQIQFNSLVKNEANNQIADKPTGNSVSLDGSTVTQDLYFVSSINTGKGDFMFDTILEDQAETKFLIKDFDNSKLDGGFQCQGNNKEVYTITGTYKKEQRVTDFMEGEKFTTDYTISNITYAKLNCVEKVPTSLSRSSSSASVKSNSSTKISNLKTYTNEYFPDFKLVYPEDWKFETSTRASNYKNLLDRTITLSKNGIKIQVDNNAKSEVGCGGGGIQEVKTEKLASGVNKIYYKLMDGKDDIFVKYGEATDCIAGKLTSNLIASQYSEYRSAFGNQNDTKVIYTFGINVSIPSVTYIKENDSRLQEIDQIISQSTFR